MPAQRHQKHTIDFLFPAALFLVFAVSALCVMLLAAGIYRQSAGGNGQKRRFPHPPLSYISEKIHQGDSGDAVHLGTFDGLDALAIQQTVGDDSYTTYIYLYEKELKELFIKDGVQGPGIRRENHPVHQQFFHGRAEKRAVFFHLYR